MGKSEIKTVGDHVKAAVSYSAPTQTIATFFGVILAYYNQDMPTDVLLAYTGLFAFAFNVVYVFVIKLVDKNN